MKRLKAGKEEYEMETRPEPPISTGRTKCIVMRGTQYCIESDGVDKNFGCYSSKQQAQAVMDGKSFIEPNFPQNLYAGGPGSGRHPQLEKMKQAAMQEFQRVFKLAQQAGNNEQEAHKAAVEAYMNKFQDMHPVKAGGPGSGRRPSGAKGLNKWKGDTEERKLARRNPKQKSLFGPGHVAEIQKKVKEGRIEAWTDCDWITVHGQHICIKPGQSKGDAIKQHFSKLNKSNKSVVKNAEYTKKLKGYEGMQYSKVTAANSKSGSKEYWLIKGGKTFGPFKDRDSMYDKADKLASGRHDEKEKVKEKEAPVEKISSKQFIGKAVALAKSMGITYNGCDDGGSDDMWAAGCGKVEQLYKKMGLSTKIMDKVNSQIDDWLGSPNNAIMKAAQEVIAGNPKSDLAKGLAIENAIVQAKFGSKTITLYRGINDDYAQKAVNTALQSDKATFKFKLNGADSWSDQRSSSEDFGPVLLKTEVPTKYIMTSWKTNSQLKDYGEQEFIVAFPKGNTTLNRKDLIVNIADAYYAAAEKEEDDVIDLTNDKDWLRKASKKKKENKEKKTIDKDDVQKKVNASMYDTSGEPLAGALQQVHMDTNLWFHPPSLKKPERVPTDDPGEKNDRFLDKTKRDSKDTKEQRMKLLKRSAPGGLPPQIPAHTTAVEPHSAYYQLNAAARRRRRNGGMYRAYGAAHV